MMAKIKLISVVATFDTEETRDKSGKVSTPAMSRQIRLDVNDRAVQTVVDKAYKAQSDDG